MGNPLQRTPTVGKDMREDVEQFDVIIIGAGVTGLYALYRLRAARALGPGLRGWGWRGRHLVLEPLPRGALRLRELYLRVFVLGGTPAGMGLERTLFWSAGERALPQLCGGQVRPAPGHPVQRARGLGRL